MKFELKAKGGRTLTSTEENEKLVCFKCGKGKYDYKDRGNYTTPVDNGLIWYWCEQRYDLLYFNTKASFVFCSRTECKLKSCSKNSEHERHHQDWAIDNIEGFQ